MKVIFDDSKEVFNNRSKVLNGESISLRVQVFDRERTDHDDTPNLIRLFSQRMKWNDVVSHPERDIWRIRDSFTSPANLIREAITWLDEETEKQAVSIKEKEDSLNDYGNECGLLQWDSRMVFGGL